MRVAAKARRACETETERKERLSSVSALQKRKRESFKLPGQLLSNTRKQQLWHYINQNVEPTDIKTGMDLEDLSEMYERDLKRFKQGTIDPLYYEHCSVCGILTNTEDQNRYEIENEIFNPIRHESISQDLTEWQKHYLYCSDQLGSLLICKQCTTILKKKTNNIPRFSRATIPIPSPVDELRDLTFIEQMLISPIPPMVFVWRYKTFGQYQSKGQCVAFHNRIQKVIECLPRTLAEVFVNVKDLYGHTDVIIRVKALRSALVFLKSNHPAYENITIREERFKVIEKELNPAKETHPTDKIIVDSTEALSACQMVQNAGQNQSIEEHVAQVALTSPLTIEAITLKENISRSIKHLFKSISQKNSPKFTSPSILEGWPLMFPFLLWDGKGGPDSCIHAKVSLREWTNYVIQIPSLDFRKNVIFISFANIVLRRQRITGLTSHKPISNSVEQAVKELVSISQSSYPTDVPEATLNALSRKVGAYVDDLPGSLSDMKNFEMIFYLCKKSMVLLHSF